MVLGEKKQFIPPLKGVGFLALSIGKEKFIKPGSVV